MASEHVIAMMKKSFETSGDVEQNNPKAAWAAGKASEMGQNKVCQGIVFLISTILPIAFIVVGSLYLGQCNIQQYIPIWLLVHGVANLLLVVASKITSEEGIMAKIFKFVKGLLELFNVIWFITGNVWVFGAWSEDPEFEDLTSEKSCDPTVFFMALIGGICIPYICILSCCCCTVCCAVCCAMAKKGSGS